MVVGFAIPGFAIITDQFYVAAQKDFGGNAFWDNWGCDLNQYWGYCYSSYCSNYQPGNWFNNCNSHSYDDAGYIISTVTLAFYVLFSVYSWIGSWCCSCCCPGIEEEVFPSATVSIHYSAVGGPTSTTTATAISTMSATNT